LGRGLIEVPPSVRRRLSGKSFWHFATVNDDGSPTVTPVWAALDDRGYVTVNTALGRRKERNLRRDPRVALSSTGRADPYSWVEIRGRVVEFIEGPAANDSIAALQRKYLGHESGDQPPDEQRVILVIAPTRINHRTESGSSSRRRDRRPHDGQGDVPASVPARPRPGSSARVVEE
jgi:PPOX class probable F420-dependent enzyme